MYRSRPQKATAPKYTAIIDRSASVRKPIGNADNPRLSWPRHSGSCTGIAFRISETEQQPLSARLKREMDYNSIYICRPGNFTNGSRVDGHTRREQGCPDFRRKPVFRGNCERTPPVMAAAAPISTTSPNSLASTKWIFRTDICTLLHRANATRNRLRRWHR